MEVILVKFNLTDRAETFAPLWRKLDRCQTPVEILSVVYTNFVGDLLKHAVPKVFMLTALGDQIGATKTIDEYRLKIFEYAVEEVYDSVKSGKYDQDTELLATIALW
jgi:hypothetical protein